MFKCIRFILKTNLTHWKLSLAIFRCKWDAIIIEVYDYLHKMLHRICNVVLNSEKKTTHQNLCKVVHKSSAPALYRTRFKTCSPYYVCKNCSSLWWCSWTLNMIRIIYAETSEIRVTSVRNVQKNIKYSLAGTSILRLLDCTVSGTLLWLPYHSMGCEWS